MDNLDPETRSRCMSRIRSRDTKPEFVVRSAVHRLGYRFRLHRKDLPGSPDLVFPRLRAVIFVHGCFWHWHPEADCPIAGIPKSNLEYWGPKLLRTRIRDRENVDLLQEAGWQVMLIWECELRHRENLLGRVRQFLEGQENAVQAREASRSS